jgi:hypothetical protein
LAYLLDVNVLVAFAFPNHEHHERVHEWFAKRHSNGWATCPMTQSAFVRLSSNPRMTPSVSVGVALELLERMTGLLGHSFLPDDIEPVRDYPSLSGKLVGHRQISDAHLVLLARRNDHVLATLDTALPSLLPAVERNALVEVIAPQ